MTSTAWRSRIVGYGEANPRDLVGNPRNWRTHPDHQRAALSGVLDEVGWVAEVLVNKRSGFVVDGHLRVVAALERGESVVPVRYVDLSEDEERLVLATIDPISALAGSDPDTLTALLEGLRPADAAVASLLRDLAPPVPKELNPDDADLTPPDEQVTRLGDLWLLGDHRLLCGDSTRAEDVARLLDGGVPAIMVTDPPYGVGYDPTIRDTATARDSITGDDRADWIEAWRLFPGDVAYSWHPPGAMSLIHAKALQDAGFSLKRQLIWAKPYPVMGRYEYHWQHEPCWYGVRGEDSHWIGDRTQTTVITEPQPGDPYGRGEERFGHATQKPLECMARPIRNHAGDVYEPFAGSGTTLVAAEQLGRRCYAMEIEPAYCDVVVRRWETLTGRKAERVGQTVEANP